ncbi:MAG: hypothetical protein LBV11_21605 [Bacillus cereus]|nr:hypothetical protein [Bacillus cereus]
MNIKSGSKDTSGSASFENQGTVVQKDLYYAIHKFNYSYVRNTGKYTLTDRYDISYGDYNGIAGVAIDTMWQPDTLFALKGEKRTLLILLAVIAIPLFFFILCPVFLYFYGHFSYSEKKAYEINWGISLPDQMKLMNDKNTTSFRGDGLRHTMYQVNKMEDLKRFEVEKREEIENFCAGIINNLEVEAKYNAFCLFSLYRNEEVCRLSAL